MNKDIYSRSSHYSTLNIETRQSIQIGLQDYYIPLIEYHFLLVVCSNPVGLSVLIVSFLYYVDSSLFNCAIANDFVRPSK